MWRRFTQAAEAFERQLSVITQADPSNPADATRALHALREFGASRDVMGSIVDEIANSKEATASKLKNLEKSMAPMLRTIELLSGLIAQRGWAEEQVNVSMWDTVINITSMLSYSCITADPTFPTVPYATLTTLTEPFWHLGTVARLVAHVPSQERSAMGVALPGLEYSDVNRVMESIAKAADALLTISTEHPQGRRLMTEKTAGLTAMLEALWTLVPLLTRVAPPVERALIFRWSEAYRRLFRLQVHIKIFYPQTFNGVAKILAKLMASLAAAQTSGDAAEKERALDVVKWFSTCPITAMFDSEYKSMIMPLDSPERKAYRTILRRATAPEDIAHLLRTAAALRAAATAPGCPVEFSVFSAHLIAGICALCAFALAETGPDGGVIGASPDAIKLRCSSPFIDCVQMAVQGWTDMVRGVSAVPELNFWYLQGKTLMMLAFAFDACDSVDKSLSKTTESVDIPDDIADLYRFEVALAEVAAAPLVHMVRFLATFVASMPAALVLPNDRPSVAEQNRVFQDMGRLQATRIHKAALRYAMVAATCFKDGDAPFLEGAAQAAHACLNAALALSAGAHTLKADILDDPVETDPPEVAADAWCSVALILAGRLASIDGDGEAAALITLHCLAAIPEPSRGSETFYISFAVFLMSISAELSPALVPEDADALKMVLQRSKAPPEAAAGLEELIVVAKADEGLGERQRRRLEMLGRLPPGICANLRCSEFLPAGAKVKKCKGCHIAHFCGPKCLKYAWKHGGHKAACHAVQREREG